MFKSLKTPALRLLPLTEVVPTRTLNAARSRSFASHSDARIQGQLWRTWAQESFQRVPSKPRLVSQPTSGIGRGARRGFRSTAWRRSNAGSGAGQSGQQAQPQTLRGRLRKLMREYGWVAVGVYFGLSVVDFPLSFLIVRIAGAETIGNIEHYIVSGIGKIIPESIRQGSKDLWNKTWQAFKKKEEQELGSDEVSDKVKMVGWGVEEAEERNRQDASLATQLALAYAIHKSFIFIRVPLTAAMTPKVVKVLRSWGWNIGKRTRRP